MTGPSGCGRVPGRHRPLLLRALFVSLLLAAVLKGLYAYLLLENGFGQLTLSFALGGPALGIAYLIGLTMLCQHARWLRRLRPLAAAGRMALSNYIGQSVVATLIFYGYGLGLYGEIGRASATAMALALYGAQVWYSRRLLERYSMGPMERLWRNATYGRFN